MIKQPNRFLHEDTELSLECRLDVMKAMKEGEFSPLVNDAEFRVKDGEFDQTAYDRALGLAVAVKRADEFSLAKYWLNTFVFDANVALERAGRKDKIDFDGCMAVAGFIRDHNAARLLLYFADEDKGFDLAYEHGFAAQYIALRPLEERGKIAKSFADRYREDKEDNLAVAFESMAVLYFAMQADQAILDTADPEIVGKQGWTAEDISRMREEAVELYKKAGNIAHGNHDDHNIKHALHKKAYDRESFLDKHPAVEVEGEPR